MSIAVDSRRGRVALMVAHCADPEYYDAPFTIKRAWNRSSATHPLEYDCMENPRQEDFENAYCVRDRYRPTCMRVKGQGAELSRVVCRRAEE